MSRPSGRKRFTICETSHIIGLKFHQSKVSLVRSVEKGRKAVLASRTVTEAVTYVMIDADYPRLAQDGT